MADAVARLGGDPSSFGYLRCGRVRGDHEGDEGLKRAGGLDAWFEALQKMSVAHGLKQP